MCKFDNKDVISFSVVDLVTTINSQKGMAKWNKMLHYTSNSESSWDYFKKIRKNAKKLSLSSFETVNRIPCLTAVTADVWWLSLQHMKENYYSLGLLYSWLYRTMCPAVITRERVPIFQLHFTKLKHFTLSYSLRIC